MFELDFTEALAQLGPNAATTLANEARPAANRLFAQLLPEVGVPDYKVEAQTMTIRAPMAGIVGMDSPYPESFAMTADQFLENTAKVANALTLPEAVLRRLQDHLSRLRAGTGLTPLQTLQTEVLNFVNKAIVQPHLDTFEYLRGQALANGKIDWRYNGIHLEVDYEIPAGNFLTERTGTAAYHDSASTWWQDYARTRRLLKGGVRALIARTEMIEGIISNPANNVRLLAQQGSVYRFGRIVGNTEQLSPDARDQVTLVGYDDFAEIVDPDDRTRTKEVYFMPMGRILAVGVNQRTGYRVGEGSTPDPALDRALGYTHIAPTIEGKGATGRWARVFTPQDRPWQLRGEGVTNGLPVIEAPEKIVVMRSAAPPA